jgi:hypothetical protein
MAPMAICHHLKMLPSVTLVNEPTSLFRKLPVLFTSKENYFESNVRLTKLFIKLLVMKQMNFSTQKTVVPIKI